MNDELKATLEWLKECGNNDYIFETGNSRMLLDYITNLQQENKQLKQQFDKYKKKITPLKMLQQLEVLEQENQELKEDISFCLHSIKQEMEMSTDSRTRNEMTSCYEILKRWNK